MKIWQKNTTNSIDKKVEEFTVGKDKEFDTLLAAYDIKGSMAHCIMLQKVGLLSETELESIMSGLGEIEKELQNGQISLNDFDGEDVHSVIEEILTQKVGEAGKKIHSGRSRNDQVAVDIKLFLKDKINEIVGETHRFFNLLISLSEKHKDHIMPGYTHMQLAMNSSFGLWFGAFAESLVDDLEMLVGAKNIIDKNPLGSGAGYGSSFPLDRELTTELLGFNTLNWNSINAQHGRGKGEKAMASALTFLASTLSKLAMDCCIFINEHHKFISFPEYLTTGSSIMPHKKNPDVFELIRGKCNRILSLPNELNLLCANLPTGYHREMQLTKEILFPAIEDIIACIQMSHLMLSHIEINTSILKDPKYLYIFTVDAVNQHVNQGIPFREAYKIVGEQVNNGTFHYNTETAEKPKNPHQGSIYKLCNDKIIEEMRKLMEKF